MRKKWAAGLLCALLVCQLALPARAVGPVYFVAAEESVLPLSDAAMPFWANGYLYVSTSVFTSFGISVINNTAKKMTVLEKERRALLFDWTKGTAQDSSGTPITPGAIQSGGSIFVPASAVAGFFGLQYSVTEVSHGYLVWLRSPDFGMTAKDFANAAIYNMEERYGTYLKDIQAADSPQTPAGSEAPPSGTRIHLCVAGDQRSGALLDALDRASGWATFYCTPEFMEENGALLRRMVAGGHTVGILVESGEDADTPEAQIRRGNDALYRATLGRTRLLCLENQEQTLRETWEAAGYRCLTPTLDRTGYQLESRSNAAALLARVTARRGDVSVWLGSSVSAAGLREFVSSAQSAGHYCRAMTETG